jgi:hypothetical protein
MYAFDIKHAAKLVSQYKEHYDNIVGIEAEWGDYCLSSIDNDVYDIGHHGINKHNQPPSARWDLYKKFNKNTLFIFSHFDLDSVFGCWILEGSIENNDFNKQVSQLIAWIDQHGSHRVAELGELYYRFNPILKLLSEKLSQMKKNKYDAARIINELRDYYHFIIENGPENIGDKEFNNISQEDACNALDKKLSIQNELHVFISYKNYLNMYQIECSEYNYHSLSKVNIMYNNNLKRISIGVFDESIAERLFGPEGVDGYLKEFLGPLAGGRKTVGGSPKNMKVEYNKFIKIVRDVKKRLSKMKELQDE